MSATKITRNPSYPPRIIEFSRRLYADGEGHSIRDIQIALAKRGYTPSRETIRYWVEDEFREEKLHRARKYKPPGPARRKGWQWRLERMRELRRLELSYNAIANLMCHDFKDMALSQDQVRHILKGEKKNVKALLQPRRTAA